MTLNHLHLKVANIQNSIAFYTRMFGFREKVKFSEVFYFLQDEAGFDLALDQVASVMPLPAGVHFGFALKDKGEVLALLEKMKANYPGLLLNPELNDHGVLGR
jgi:catechol 2,3-dioxygenase-like lactoylglutathione lyase family enzyme